MDNKKVSSKELWEIFTTKNQEYKHMDVPEEYYFCDNKKDADELASLVKDRIKTATSSLYCLYELDKEELPSVDELSIVTDFEGSAVAIIHTLRVEQVPFNKVSEDFAKREAEGDKSLTYWQAVHKDFFTKCLKEVDLLFDEEMIVVFEFFEVLFTIDEI